MTERLAEIAHECWRTAIKREGWRHGATFDAAAKVHDALVPYENLSHYDRCALRTIIEAEGVEEHLAALVDYPRGPERPFGVEDMSEGLEVGLACDLDAAGQERGMVTKWTTTPEGCLEAISVRWANGRVSQHHPAERELRPLPKRS